MPLDAIGVLLLVLVVVFLFSRVWFHLVEGLLGLIKRLFRRKTEPSAWHVLPQEPDTEESKDVKNG